MAANFIYTPRGYINVSQIRRAAHNKDGTFRLTDHEGLELDDRNMGFGEQIVSVVPCTEPLECLTFMPGDEEHPADEVLAEPVLAWGLTTVGLVLPITPSSMEGVTESGYALRKVGQDRVYSGDNIGGWTNSEEWVASKKPSSD